MSKSERPPVPRDRTKEDRTKDLQDLIAKMIQEPDFRKEILYRSISEPEKIKQEYNLSERALNAFQGLQPEMFGAIVGKIADADSFSKGVVVGSMITNKRNTISREAVDGDVPMAADGSCYYFS